MSSDAKRWAEPKAGSSYLFSVNRFNPHAPDVTYLSVEQHIFMSSILFRTQADKYGS